MTCLLVQGLVTSQHGMAVTLQGGCAASTCRKTQIAPDVRLLDVPNPVAAPSASCVVGTDMGLGCRCLQSLPQKQLLTFVASAGSPWLQPPLSGLRPEAAAYKSTLCCHCRLPVGWPQTESKAPVVQPATLGPGRRRPAPRLQQQLQQRPAGHAARTPELQLPALALPLLFLWATQLRKSAPAYIPEVTSAARLPLRLQVRQMRLMRIGSLT